MKEINILVIKTPDLIEELTQLRDSDGWIADSIEYKFGELSGVFYRGEDTGQDIENARLKEIEKLERKIAELKKSCNYENIF